MSVCAEMRTVSFTALDRILLGFAVYHVVQQNTS